MGLLSTIVTNQASAVSFALIGVLAAASVLVLIVIGNVLQQLWFSNPHEPPVIFHWFPLIGNSISYGIDPFRFFFQCREKYGDVFTFVLVGKKVTVCLGTKGSDLVLNGKLKDLNAEEVYSPLTTPTFGPDVVYDCPNAKLMEQKKFVKFGLTSEALRSYVPLLVDETLDYLRRSPNFKGFKGILNVPIAMAELTMFTASRTLQGKEVRNKFDSSFAELFHDLDMGFRPINFVLPWLPSPLNRKRDIAHKKIAKAYGDIINARRNGEVTKESEDMIWNLMACVYKDGTPVPDSEMAHIMIALLIAGQHSSSSTISWIVLRLASRPEIAEELYQEQIRVLGDPLPALTYDNIQNLSLHQNVLKETLRLHAPIHSIMRKVQCPIPVQGTRYVIPPSNVVLAAPGVTSRMPEFFPNPYRWEPHRWEEESIRKGDEKRDEKEDYGYGLISKGTDSPYLPFGAGRHRCVGEQFANVQLVTMLATLVREVRFKNVGNRKEIIGTDYSSMFSGPLRPAFVEWEKKGKEASSA